MDRAGARPAPEFSFFTKSVNASEEREWARIVREQVCEEENEEWRRAMCSKSTLMVSRRHKSEINKERLYDNNGGSGLLLEARAGTLRADACVPSPLR